MQRSLLPLIFLPVAALAAPIAIVNPGFEDISGESAYNEFTFGPLNGWNLYDPGNVTSNGDGPTYFIGTLRPEISPGVFAFFPGGAPEGARVGIAFNFAGSGGGGAYGLQQTLTATLQANTSYSLQVQVGNIASGTAVDNTFYNLNGFPGYRIDLLAGSEVLNSESNTGSIPEGEFALRTVNFTTGATHARLGEALGIRLVNLNVVDSAHPTADLEVDFDNVSLTADAVPEPGTLALLALTGAALLAAGPRKRRGPAIP